MNRRQFFLTLPTASALLAATPHDLIIKNGRLIDPAQKLDRIVDLAITNGKIAAIGQNLSGRQTIDATGKLVTPGLIDIHVHARDAELPPSVNLSTGCTTIVDGGSRGADNLDDLLTIARNAPNRLRILLNIARYGNNLPTGRGEFLENTDLADVAKCRAAIERNRSWIVGIKARLSRNIAATHDLEVLRRARQVADAVKLPIMIHMGDTESPLPKILELMRGGDIVSHCYAPPPHGIMDDKGAILPEVWAARRRGVRFDFGNGRTEHWTWEVAQNALKQGFPPDTISTDLSLPGRADQVFDLPTTMSKFLHMGMPLSQVIACVTTNSARSFQEFKALGTLKPGCTADVTILELAAGSFDLVDNYKGHRTATQKLVARTTLFAGKV